jgi:hypothetical protein
MSDDQTEGRSKADAELEREIRRGRDFSLGEAIGRMAGPGMMKGVSPVTGLDQAKVEIQEYLTLHLADAPGALATVLQRAVETSELLLNNFEQPLAVLASYIERVLESEYRLKELVRETDAEWGRVFGERPYFDKDGCPPDPQDPYTNDSVRNTLSQLVKTLGECPRVS